jgi:hypothetical protein
MVWSRTVQAVHRLKLILKLERAPAEIRSRLSIKIEESFSIVILSLLLAIVTHLPPVGLISVTSEAADSVRMMFDANTALRLPKSENSALTTP